ncbi:hypothetical protein AC519_0249 [Pseudomonas savastanoi]|nr:hypothetical protein AC519_0249 [Pseudomonas savastanoi]
MLAREIGSCGVPVANNLLLFGSVKHWHFSDALTRIGANGLQQREPVPGHALDGAALEQRGGIGQARTQTAIVFGGVEGQVELRRIALGSQRFDLQTGQCAHLGAGLALVVEHHLEQRAVAEAALRLQGLDQLFERQFLMRLSLQGRMFDLLQQLAERGVQVEFGAQHLGVDEETDQAFGFRAGAVGNRHADTNVRLAAVAMQQGLERCQQQHEQCDALLPRDLFQVVDQRWRQLDRQPRTGVALHDRARMIGGQFQNRLLFAQLLLPVIQLPRLFSGVHPVALPQRVVGVLHVQRGQHHLTALAVAFVQAHQFIDHDRHRPAIGNDVVLGQNQHMFVSSKVQQANAQQRALFQIERALHFLLHAGFKGLTGRHGLDHQGQGKRRMDDLHSLFALLAEGSAQGFVAGNQCAETVLQRGNVQRAAQTQGRRNGVSSAFWIKLPEKPLALLRVRQAQRLAAVGLDKAWRSIALPVARRLGEGCQITRFEQVAQRQFDVQLLTDARDHLSGEQRMPAQFKKVVATPDLLNFQHISPDRRQLLFQIALRGDVGRLQLAGIRRGQRLAVQLAVGGQRHLVEDDKMRRHHVIRQMRTELGLQGFAQALLILIRLGWD